ncbi:hypothetical protein NKI39_19505 [Mesorhizobium sp. M0664]|uniref:hypothetical protein n=1 Tax=unclassified Mesorhizobium TaxID=325217 RepID=UPI003338FBE1
MNRYAASCVLSAQAVLGACLMEEAGDGGVPEINGGLNLSWRQLRHTFLDS